MSHSKIWFFTLLVSLLSLINTNALAHNYEAMIWKQTQNHLDSYKPELLFRNLVHPSQKYTICVFLPEHIDYYWQAINYGLFSAAKDLQQRLHIYSLDNDSNTLNMEHSSCETHEADAIIVYSTDTKTVDKIAHYYAKTKQPITCIHIENKKCSSVIGAPDDYQALFIINWLAKYYQSQLSQLKIALFPGEIHSLNSQKLMDAFLKQAKANKIHIAITQYNEHNLIEQSRAVLDMLNNNPDIDLVIGNDIAIQVATKIFSNRSLSKPIELISFNFSPKVLREIERKTIKFAVSENTVVLAKMAFYRTLESLEGIEKPYQISPPLELVTPHNVGLFEHKKAIAPKQFRPVLDIN